MEDGICTAENEKLDKLKKYLKGLGKVAVAFSGGVDSTFLLKVANDVLGGNVIAVTAKLSSFPEREFAEAKQFCDKMGIAHYVCKINELEIEGFSDNPPERCYICKKELFKNIIKLADEHNIINIVEGSNMDDAGDYRPGLAAISELDIKSPLKEAGLCKEEIRKLSKDMGLPTWDKPSFACLSTRFAYGERVTSEKLEMVGKAEQLLFDKGFSQVRVRIHDFIARIEIMPEEFGKLIGIREEIVSKFKSYGFIYVSMDLSGYRTGSMNEVLEKSSIVSDV